MLWAIGQAETGARVLCTWQTLRWLQQTQSRQTGKPLGFFRWKLPAVPGRRG